MPLNRPTLRQLFDRAIADVRGRLPGTDPLLRRSRLNILARTHAGAVHGLYGAIDYFGHQILPATAEAEWLERHASFWVGSRLGSTTASGQVLVTGTPGAQVPEGSQLQNGEGSSYRVGEVAVLDASGAALVNVEAAAGGGAGNMPQGGLLRFIAPVAGVHNGAEVAAGGLTGGQDDESDDALRERIRQRMHNTPHGGAAHDYERWALQVAGVRRVWIQPQVSGAGSVGIAIEGDAQTDTHTSEQSLIDAVQDHIDEQRPVTAQPIVYAGEKAPVDFRILLTPDNAATRLAVQNALDDLLIREAVPGGTIPVSHVTEAISGAAGEYDHHLMEPLPTLTAETGQIQTLGLIEWVTH